VDAASTYGTPGFVTNMLGVADMENWMRVFAANHAAGKLGFLRSVKRSESFMAMPGAAQNIRC